LALAQELGYAERDPSADIEGHDACRKICILASLAFGKHVYPDAVYTEGITKVTSEDVCTAAAADSVIKLIGRAVRQEDGRLYVTVAPTVIAKSSLLSDVNDVFNGIMVRGDCTGDVVFYGKGAGKLPTASAVVADVVDCCKHLKARRFLFWADGDGSNIIDWRDSVSAMFVRLSGDDAAAKAEKVFGEISTVSNGGELGVLTGEMSYREFENKCQALEADGISVLSGIRIGDI
jgi:homoserine dehydrogenase